MEEATKYNLKWRNIVIKCADYDNKTIMIDVNPIHEVSPVIFSYSEMDFEHSDDHQFLKMAVDRFMAKCFCDESYPFGYEDIVTDYVRDILRNPYDWGVKLTYRRPLPILCRKEKEE